MSNSKRYKRWVSDLIKLLQSEYGLIIEDDRTNKYRILRGSINGKPYYQKFSSTPKSFTSASKNVIRETKQKLRECGIDVQAVEDAQFKIAFYSHFDNDVDATLDRLIELFEQVPKFSEFD